MSQFVDYAKYYDLFYKDKAYAAEVSYVLDVLKKYNVDIVRVLDLGAGTAQHAIEMAKRGIEITAIDKSVDMLEFAKRRYVESRLKRGIDFVHGDATSIRLRQTFDAVVSLFHVASYQTTDKDMNGFLVTANQHLRQDGLLLFDFWYGPAVLCQRPEIRIKRIEVDGSRLVRIATPTVDIAGNIVDVDFECFVIDADRGSMHVFEEKHSMRYFFTREIENFLDNNGFEKLCIYEWMKNSPPELTNYGACCLAKKVKANS